jgi:ABC-type polysaccharide/polyol phosphate transport system ATPase subunit
MSTSSESELCSRACNDSVVVSVERLNIAFKGSLHRSWTWRDAFTRLASRPVRTLRERDALVVVARDMSFTVRRGERIGILGANGAGKTSLCRCIAGIYQPRSGTIRTQGRIRAVFETAIGIQGELTGRENAELLAEFLYPEVDDKTSLVNEALGFSELGKFIDMPYKTYSNGMKTRLSLSMVSARPSDLLILDEVFDGADASFREKSSARIMEIMRRSGSVLFVSHSENQIRDACTRVLVLRDGEIAFDGPVDEGLAFYAAYASSVPIARKPRAP